jgi:hypothetical protein
MEVVAWPIHAKLVKKSTYNQNGKYEDKNKALYYPVIIMYVKSLQEYHVYYNFEHFPRVLSLEHTGMVSAKVLHQQCGIPIEYFDIVSRDVEFSSDNKNHGIFYTGELCDFLKRPEIERFRYDVLVLDSCNTWDTLKECLKIIFKRQLIDICSVIMLTCSSRSNTIEHKKRVEARNGEKLPQNNDITICQEDVIRLAKKYGYIAEARHNQFTYGTMYCLFFKVIHEESTMSYDGGIPGPWTADYWARECVVFETPTEKKIKRNIKKENALKLKSQPVGKPTRKKNPKKNPKKVYMVNFSILNPIKGSFL